MFNVIKVEQNENNFFNMSFEDYLSDKIYWFCINFKSNIILHIPNFGIFLLRNNLNPKSYEEQPYTYSDYKYAKIKKRYTYIIDNITHSDYQLYSFRIFKCSITKKTDMIYYNYYGKSLSKEEFYSVLKDKEEEFLTWLLFNGDIC